MRTYAGRVKSLIYKWLEGVSLLWAMLTMLSKFSNSLCRKLLNWSARAQYSFQFLLGSNLSATDSISFLSVGLVTLWIISLHSLGQTFKSLLQKYLFLGNEKILTRETETHTRIYTVVGLGCIKLYMDVKPQLQNRNEVFLLESFWPKAKYGVLFFWWEYLPPVLSNVKHHLQEMLFTDHIFSLKKRRQKISRVRLSVALIKWFE